MEKSTNFYYVVGALLAVGTFAVLSKKKPSPGDKPGGTISPGAGYGESALSDQDAKAIASKLINILVESWYIGDDESAQIKALFSHITDESGYRKVYNYFGYHSSTFPGYPDGDLDVWMSRVNEPYKTQCRRPGTSF